jgi:ABC-type Fe3+ transport system substrate-binding protein
MPARVAHPNAAKLYINWLLSQEGQLAASKASGGLPSARTDVPRDFVPAQSIPDPKWPPGSNEAALDAKDQAQLLALEVLGPMPPLPSS